MELRTVVIAIELISQSGDHIFSNFRSPSLRQIVATFQQRLFIITILRRKTSLSKLRFVAIPLMIFNGTCVQSIASQKKDLRISSISLIRVVIVFEKIPLVVVSLVVTNKSNSKHHSIHRSDIS